NVCIPPRILRARALDSRRCSASCTSTVGAFGRRPSPNKALPSFLRSPKETPSMSKSGADAVILLVEDNPRDETLTLRALEKSNVANRVVVARDGVEALDYLLARGDYAGRDIEDTPQVILLDLKLPKMDGLEVLSEIRSDPRIKLIPVVILTSSLE